MLPRSTTTPYYHRIAPLSQRNGGAVGAGSRSGLRPSNRFETGSAPAHYTDRLIAVGAGELQTRGPAAGTRRRWLLSGVLVCVGIGGVAGALVQFAGHSVDWKSGCAWGLGGLVGLGMDVFRWGGVLGVLFALFFFYFLFFSFILRGRRWPLITIAYLNLLVECFLRFLLDSLCYFWVGCFVPIWRTGAAISSRVLVTGGR